ncbi:MAG: hypothetical protein L0027_07205, partial [Candidatus Rokubacteria bacterium]|nr:hypothetical protein [Candidatus Rokubacteria bacterium]
IEAMERVHAETGQSIVNDLMNLAWTPLALAVQTVADAPIRSVLEPPGSESVRRNAPLECVTCHH